MPPAGGSSNFSTADFMDEGPLPSWMRTERSETGGSSDMSMSSPEHLSSFPGQAPDGGTFPPNGLAAQSLIDEKSLPSWMKEGSQPPPSAPGSLSASSLLQQDNVPDWMKTVQPQPNAAPAAYQEQAGRFEQSTNAPRASDLGPGFSARDLLDQQALPSWMKSQSERSASAPQTEPFGQTGQSASMQQSGLSASSLLDADSLPQWMREGGRDARPNATPPQPAWPTQTPPGWPESNSNMPSNQAWSMGQTPPTPAQPPMQSNPAYGPNGSMPASSFVDANAIPEWLRNAGEQGSQGMPPAQAGPAGPQRQSPYAIPPRVDNVRVPSRPRGNNEPGASESSEVAANVFASMLGVASTAPTYPNQPNQPQRPSQQPLSQPEQMGAMPSGSFSGPRAVPNTPNGGGVSPYAPANTLGTSGGGIPASPGYGNSFPGNNPGQAGNSNSMGSPYYPGMPPSQPMHQSGEMNDDQKNAKKRGLFGAFLDWLSR